MIALDPPFAFIAGEFRIRCARAGWEREASRSLRRQVFCAEQGVFAGDDADAVDAHAIPIVALACIAGDPHEAAGTVRIHRHESQADTWWGSRLGVARDYRGVAWIGSELIRHAVGTALGHGCTRFLAHVQSQNAGLFRRLRWHTVQEVVLHGRPHHLMEADLSHYLARTADDIVFVPRALQAA
ncbi:MAG: hypothetical protein B7Z52_07330 [Burkholderiales bacterium 12-64-5]|nr:MAG: hypothetical protein B7Z52_07330 [Burkholderiales bacterium 12-64-5]